MGALRLTPHTSFLAKLVAAMRTRLIEAGLCIPPAASEPQPELRRPKTKKAALQHGGQPGKANTKA